MKGSGFGPFLLLLAEGEEETQYRSQTTCVLYTFLVGCLGCGVVNLVAFFFLVS